MVNDVKLGGNREGPASTLVAKVHLYWKENSGQNHCWGFYYLKIKKIGKGNGDLRNHTTLFGFNNCT